MLWVCGVSHVPVHVFHSLAPESPEWAAAALSLLPTESICDPNENNGITEWLGMEEP